MPNANNEEKSGPLTAKKKKIQDTITTWMKRVQDEYSKEMKKEDDKAKLQLEKNVSGNLTCTGRIQENHPT